MPPRHFLPSAGGDDDDGTGHAKTFKSVKWKWLQEYEKEKELEEQRAREEQQRQEREEAERRTRQEAERAAREEAERKAKEEAEAQAREEAERAAREAAEAREREEADQRARVEAERRAAQEAARKTREETERRNAEEKARRAVPVAMRNLPLDDDDDLVVLSRPEPAPRKAAAPTASQAAARRQLAGHASSSNHGEPLRRGLLPATQDASRLRARPAACNTAEGGAGEATPGASGQADTAGEAAAGERETQLGVAPDGGRGRTRLPTRTEQQPPRPSSRAADEDPSRSNQQDSTATKAGTTPQRVPLPGSHHVGRLPAEAEPADSDEEETLMFSRRGGGPRRANLPPPAAEHSPSRKAARRDAAGGGRRTVVEDVQSSEELPPSRHVQLVRVSSQQGSKGHRGGGGDIQGLGRQGSSTRGGHERGKDLGKSNLGRAIVAEAATAAAGSSVLPSNKSEPYIKQEVAVEGGGGMGTAVNQESAAAATKPSPENDESFGRAGKRLRGEAASAAEGARPNASWESKQHGRIKVEAETTSSQAGHSTGAVVECYLEDGSIYNSQEVDLTWMQNFKDLWLGLRRAFPSTLPDKLHAKLVYLDHDGDWIMVYPEHTRWSTFRADATKIMVSRKT